MKKTTFLLLTVFFHLYSFAQTFKGVIKETGADTAVPHITIVSDDNTFFVTSNEKGEVVLPENILNKKLKIADYYYEYSEKVFTTSQPFVWELTPNSETLEEIVIYENPEVYLDEIIANSIKSFSSNVKLESYYRENYIENNQIARFSEGILDFYIDNSNNIHQIVKQTRAESIAEINEFSEILMTSPKGVVDTALRFNAIRKLIKDKKRYEIYVTAKKVGDKIVHTCYINPKQKSKKRFLMKGYFTFDEERKLILETNYAFAPEKKTYNRPVNVLVGKVEFIDIQFKSKYIVTDAFYYPSYAENDIDIIANSKLGKVKNERAHNQSYFYILSADKATKIPAESKAYSSSSLYRRGTIYKDEFWKRPEIIYLRE